MIVPNQTAVEVMQQIKDVLIVVSVAMDIVFALFFALLIQATFSNTKEKP
jgi:hypothetical protein